MWEHGGGGGGEVLDKVVCIHYNLKKPSEMEEEERVAVESLRDCASHCSLLIAPTSCWEEGAGRLDVRLRGGRLVGLVG